MWCRAAVLLCGVVVVCHGSRAADAPAAQPAAPTPLARRVAWYQRVTRDAFDAAAQKDPKWEADARQCVDAFRRSLDQPGLRRNGDEEDLIFLFGQKAIQAGCKDPLVIYAFARNLTLRAPRGNALADAHRDAADRFKDSKYPAFWKTLASLRAARYLSDAAGGDEAKLKQARAYVDAALQSLPEAFADKDLPAYELYEFMRAVVDAQTRTGDQAGALGEKVLAALEKGALPKSVALTARGDYYLLYGWEARGTGYANTVTRAGGAAFRQRVQAARDALLEAWKLDPSNAEAACAMLIVEKAMGTSRKDLEQWYQRALGSDPDSYRAAMRKVEYLYPQWHGSPEEMVAHARQVAATARWEGGMPLVLVEVHWELAGMHDPGKKPVDPAYFANNPEAWKDVKAVYEAYLRRVPDSRYHRTRYALIAAWCGQWSVAQRQFAKLGEDFSRRPVPEALYRQARALAAANAASTPQAAGENQPPAAPAKQPDPALPF